MIPDSGLAFRPRCGPCTLVRVYSIYELGRRPWFAFFLRRSLRLRPRLLMRASW